MNTVTRILAAAMLATATLPATVHFAAAQSSGHSGVALADHNMRVSKLIGMTVTSPKGETLGTIADVLVKGDASEPMVVLQVDPKKMVAVPMSHLVLKDDKITMAGTKPEVMAMPPYLYMSAGGNG